MKVEARVFVRVHRPAAGCEGQVLLGSAPLTSAEPVLRARRCARWLPARPHSALTATEAARQQSCPLHEEETETQVQKAMHGHT